MSCLRNIKFTGDAKQYDPTVLAYQKNIATAGGTISSTHLIAHDVFVKRLKKFKLWAKLDEIYTFGGNQLAAGLVKLKYTSQATLTNHNFVSGDFTSAGLLGDGSTKYLQTGHLDSYRALTDKSMGIYQTAAATTGSRVAFGTIVSTSSLNIIRAIDQGDGSDMCLGSQGSGIGVNIPINTGLYVVSRTGGAGTCYQNALTLGPATYSGMATGLEFYVFAANASGTASAYSNARMSFAYAGGALTTQDEANLYDCVLELLETMGRISNPAAAYWASTVLPADLQVISSGVATGKTIYWAAPTYAVGAAMDTWLATDSYPSQFTDAHILDQINVYAGNPDVHGNFVSFVSDASAFSYQCGDLGTDVTNHHSLGDPIWTIPFWCLDYYNRTGDITPFTTYSAAMKTNLQGVPRDPNGSHLVYVPTTTTNVWRPFGFQDGIDKGGNDAFGSIFYWKAAMAMVALYTIAGDATNAAVFQTDANNIKASIGLLVDGATGMLLSCSYPGNGNSSQIDIFASALAVYFGILTEAQNERIASWLYQNLDASVMDPNGYVYQSTAVWNQQRFTGGPAQGNYDDGSWAFGFMWVVAAIRRVDRWSAKKLVRRASYGADPSMEWWRRQSYAHSPNNGATNNLCSTSQIIGALAIA